MRLRFCALATVLAITSSCSPRYFASCEMGASTTTRDLILQSVDRIVRSSQLSKETDIVRYRSNAEFFALNPNCCYVYIDKKLSSDEIALPFSGEASIMSYYKKYRHGDHRFYIVNTDMDPCPENFEDGGTRESDLAHALFLKNSHFR